MKAAEIESAYQLVQKVAASKRRQKPTEATIYRLVRSGGVIRSVRGDTLEVLAEVFGCDVPDLFAKSEGKR